MTRINLKSPGKEEISGFIIERTAKKLKHAFQRTLIKIEAGITADQWVILDLIFQEPGLGQFEIAEKTSKDPPTVTRILDLLVRKRLVERTADPSDRRKYIISLTAAGKETVKRLYPKVQRFRVQHFDGLSDKDMYHLLRILKQINQNIQ